MRTEDEIQDQLDKAAETLHDSRWRGMTYEQGVDQALRWVMEWDDAPPMDE